MMIDSISVIENWNVVNISKFKNGFLSMINTDLTLTETYFENVTLDVKYKKSTRYLFKNI